MRHVGRKLAMPALVILGLCFGAYFVSRVGAGDQERTMHQLINDARHDRGIPRLDVTDFLRGYAEHRAAVIARNGRLFPHDPCGGCGEVSGVAPGGFSTLRFFGYWMRSDVHRGVLMYRGVDRLGCGVVNRGGYQWWICEIR